MFSTAIRKVALVGVVALALAACGGDDSTDTTSVAGNGSGETTAAPDSGSAATTTQADAATGTTTAPSGGGGGGAGSAVLTVGDQSWEFDNFYCFDGPENTGNSRVSFSSGSFGEQDGNRTQLDASIQDTDEQGRHEGEGTIQSVSLNDVDDFENPVVSLDATTGFVGAPDWLIVYDGSTVTAEALFDDGTTENVLEETPGTLEGVCGS